MAKKRLLSGMRSTGKLHLGNYVGALGNWIRLQDEYDCFFMVADWHAVTSEYADTSGQRELIVEIYKDWLSAGLDPKRAVLFIQSQIKQHAELALLLGMFTPVPWLERVPTFKEQIAQLSNKDLNTYGFLGYPVLQAADIIIYQASVVPVGEDQVPHLEMCRELVRRINNMYGDVFVEPQPLLSPTPKLVGTDGRKMSKSYGNCIYLSDSAGDVEKKTGVMITDPARVRRHDLGHPEVCSVFWYHQAFNKGETEQIAADCRSAALGCTDCKKNLAKKINRLLDPMRKRRAELEKNPDALNEIISDGNKRALAAAEATMRDVREKLHLWQ